MEARNKPDFFRQGWHKFHRLGKHVKKRRKWRHPTGGDSKTRMKERGKPLRPTIGWGSDKSIRGKVQGFELIRIESVEQIEAVKKGQAIIIAHLGKRKKDAIIAKANEKGIKILNKYKDKKNATQ